MTAFRIATALLTLLTLLVASASAPAQNGKSRESRARASSMTQENSAKESLEPATGTAPSNDAEESMKRIKTVLAVLNQELTATYDQIEALKRALDAELSPRWRPPGIETMDELTEAKRKASERENEIRARIEQAFKRIKEIDAQKQPILERLQEYLDKDKEAEAARKREELSKARSP